MRSDDVEGAINASNDVLASAAEGGGLGHKYEAACLFNLAVAYRKAGEDSRAIIQFNRVIEEHPVTVYGQAAQQALSDMRKSRSSQEKP